MNLIWRKPTGVAALWGASLLGAGNTLWAETPRFDTAERMPAGCWATVTVFDGASRVAEFRKCNFVTRLQEAKGYHYFLSQPNVRQGLIALAMAPALTGKDIWEIASLGLGREATLGVYAGEAGKPPPTLLVSVGADEASIKEVLEKLQGIAGVTVGGEPDEDRSRKVAGARVYEFDKGLRQAYVAGALYLSNDDELIDRALRMRKRKAGPALSGAEFWRTATREVAGDAVVMAAIELGTWRKVATPEGWPEKLPNPLAALLFRDWTARLGTAATWMGTLHASPDEVRIESRLHDGQSASGEKHGQTKFAHATPNSRKTKNQKAEAPLFELAEVRNGVSALTLHRDLHKWWADREESMTIEAVGQFAQFAGVMSTFTGQDFDGELLPHVADAAQFIVARQTFGEDGPVPSPALPGFALVFRLKPGATVGPRLDTAAVMAVSFVNFDAGQKRQPQYEIGMHDHRGCKVICATYPPREADDARPTGVRYNFSPAFARAGNVAIIGTTREIVQDLIDAAKAKKKEAGGSTAADLFEMDGAEFMAVLRQNRDLFVTQRMLEADVPKREARRFVDALLELGGLVRTVSVTASAERGEASLRIRLR